MIIILILGLVGCGRLDKEIEQQNEETGANETNHINDDNLHITWISDTLEFTSLEDLLETYRKVQKGEDDDVTNSAESVNFASLEKIYLASSIPELYQLYKIIVFEELVTVRFLRKEDLISEDTARKAINQDQHFSFGFYRWDLDSPLDGILRQNNATEKDLIDEKYLFVAPNRLIWALDRGVMYMNMPLSLITNDIEEMVRFAEVTVIDIKED